MVFLLLLSTLSLQSVLSDTPKECFLSAILEAPLYSTLKDSFVYKAVVACGVSALENNLETKYKADVLPESAEYHRTAIWL